MSRVVGALVVVVLLGCTVAAAAPRSSSQSSNQARPQNQQAQASLPEQLETCRQQVVQLDAQLRTHQKRLVTLRSERRTVGGSGGEMARFKLAALDNEIRELSRQSQNLITQIDTEGSRCEAIAAKIAGNNRGTQSQQPAKPPARSRQK